MDNEELKRLNKILSRIEFAKGDESRFDEIYLLMQHELPNADTDKDSIFKEARVYIGEKKKHPKDKEGNSYNYSEFITNFKDLVTDKKNRG